MFLGGSFLGISFLESPTPAIITSSYDKVTIYGQGSFDKIWIRNRIEPDSYFAGLTSATYIPVFDSDTVFLADFNNNLSAGNISSGGESVLYWTINKRQIGDSVYSLVATVDATTLSIKDYRVQRDKTYVYQILPVTATTVGQPLETANMVADYYGWFLIDEESGISYKMDIEVQSGNLQADQDQTEYQTYNKYNTISQGARNFMRGQISGIVPEVLTYEGNGMIQSADFITQIQDFINNGKPKLLKSRKGDIWKVMTNGFSRSQLLDQIGDQIDVVSFGFIETEDVTNY